MPESLTTGTVTLYGPCAQTGKIVEMTLRDGQMRRGKPGKAWAASILPPGQSNGLFASEDALNAWIAAHPDAKVESKGTVVEAYQSMLAAKD